MFEGIIFTLKIPVKGKQRLATVENFRETFLSLKELSRNFLKGQVSILKVLTRRVKSLWKRE